MKTITLEVDAVLAKEYRDLYLELGDGKKISRLSPKKFFRAFVEDRLREEIDFVREELTEGGSRSAAG